jgi:hypothetical protein
MSASASNLKDGSKEGMAPWEPERYLSELAPEEVRYSRGFLRSRPERWFPGFEAHWMTLAHGFAMELRVIDVRAFVPAPLENFARTFLGTVDNEQIAFCIDRTSLHNVLDAFAPTVQGNSENVLIEYLARRLLGSLAMCWSGPESSVIRFDSEGEVSAASWVGGVRLQLMLNGKAATVWVMLGRFMMDRLDGLWRRQIYSTGKGGGDASSEIFIEIAQLAVPPSTLVDYVRVGTAVDLEIPITDVVTLRSRNKPILSGRIRTSRGKLVIETSPGQPMQQMIPDGTTRLSICCGIVSVDAATVAEIGQTQAILETGLPASDSAVLVVNGEKVADARLCVYEGRFAIQV